MLPTRPITNKTPIQAVDIALGCLWGAEDCPQLLTTPSIEDIYHLVDSNWIWSENIFLTFHGSRKYYASWQEKEATKQPGPAGLSCFDHKLEPSMWGKPRCFKPRQILKLSSWLVSFTWSGAGGAVSCDPEPAPCNSDIVERRNEMEDRKGNECPRAPSCPGHSVYPAIFSFV